MKLALDNNELAEDFFSDASIMGIVAPIKDYRFCWLLNQAMNCDFRRNRSLEIEMIKKGRQYYFSIFDYSPPGHFIVHYIYNNQFDGEYLLPEFRHLDFLWLIKGSEIDKEYLMYLQNAIKNIQGVQLITELDRSKIKNKLHLVF